MGGGHARPKFQARRRIALNPRTGGFLGIEKKFLDLEFDDTMVVTMAGSESDPPGTGAQTAPGGLSCIAQGDGESQRDGRQAVLKDILIRGVLRRVGGSDKGVPSFVRLILLQDTQTNGAQFNAEDVYVDPSNADLDALTYRNLQFASRFKILHDQVYSLPVTASAGNGTANDNADTLRNFTISKKLQIKVNYSGTTAVIANTTDNSLHLMAIAGPGALAGAVSLFYTSRLRFVG